MREIHSLPRSVVREAIFQSQGGLCFWCGRKMRLPRKADTRLPPNAATLEHLIPSNNNPGNIVVACHACNNRRGNSMIDPVSGDKFTIVDGRVVRIPKVVQPIAINKKPQKSPSIWWGLLKRNPSKKNLALFIGANRR